MNTTKEAGPEAGQGEGAGALSPMGTIATERLSDLWLPAERAEREALDFMDRQCTSAYRRSPFGKAAEHMNRARCALLASWIDTVRCIQERGGLLLIGGRA